MWDKFKHSKAERNPVALLIIVLVASALVLASPGAVLAETVVATIVVGTRPVGVGVNPTTNKVYVANYGSNNARVIDGATDTVTRNVGVGTLPIGVGVNPTTNKVYVVNEGSDSVWVIDGATDTVSTMVTVGGLSHLCRCQPDDQQSLCSQ